MISFLTPSQLIPSRGRGGLGLDGGGKNTCDLEVGGGRVGRGGGAEDGAGRLLSSFAPTLS